MSLLEQKSEGAQESKLAVFTFMRCNPPTQGHVAVVKAVETLAQQKDGKAYVFLSHNVDAKRNPMTFKQKLDFMHRVLPNTNFVDVEKPIRNPFDACGYLSSLGYTDLILVVGSDRAQEFKKAFSAPNKYFDSFKVIDVGHRDPDSEGIAGMSASNARAAAQDDNLITFQRATGWNEEQTQQLLDLVRKGMQ